MTDTALRDARRNVRLYYLYNFLMDFALWSGIWIKYLIEDRGFELKYILLMDLPFWLLVAVLQAPTGALADRIGRKRVLALSGSLFALTVLGFGFTTSYVLLFFDYVLWAFAQSSRSGADQALVYDSLKAAGREGEFQRVTGRGFSATMAAGLLSIVSGAALASIIGMAAVVQLSAIVPLVGVAAALAMHEPRIAHEPQPYLANLKDGMAFAWRHPEVRYTLLIGSVLLAGTFGPVVLVQPFLIKHQVATGLFGVYQAPLRLVAIGGAMVAFRVGLRVGIGRILVLACATIVLLYLALAGIDLEAAFVFFGFAALMQGLTRPIIDGYLNDRIPSRRRATVLSVMQLLFALQVAFFEPALGFFTDGISLAAAFLFSAAYFAVLMPPLLLLWRRAQGRAGPMVEDVVLEPAAG